MNEFKPDLLEAKDRLRDWWDDKPVDRVVALVGAPRKGAPAAAIINRAPERYTDAETVFHNVDAGLASTFYGGEAIPRHWVYLGPVPLSSYMGCEPHFTPNTVWHAKVYETWDAVDDVQFDPSNRWYRLLCDLTQASVQRAKGQYFVSGQGFGCVSDVVADMWGSEPTLMAMAERPEAIKSITQKLVDISKRLYDEIDAITAPYQDGSFDWTNLWAPGRVWTLQSDLCCMISPAMFEAYILDELRQEAEHVDYSLYHLDGPGAIQHLDQLLSMEALDGIQWVPGAGNSLDPMDWIDLFRRVQKAGKKLQISCPPHRVSELLGKIAKRGVCLCVSCPDQDSAEEVLRNLERIGGE